MKREEAYVTTPIEQPAIISISYDELQEIVERLHPGLLLNGETIDFVGIGGHDDGNINIFLKTAPAAVEAADE